MKTDEGFESLFEISYGKKSITLFDFSRTAQYVHVIQ